MKYLLLDIFKSLRSMKNSEKYFSMQNKQNWSSPTAIYLLFQYVNPFCVTPVFKQMQVTTNTLYVWSGKEKIELDLFFLQEFLAKRLKAI